MSRFKLIAACMLLPTIAVFHLAPTSAIGPATQKLTVREEPGRVVLAWSGPVAKPMRDEIAAAIDRFKTDPRRLVIALNSPGGSFAQGHEVIAAIRDAGQAREIDTLIEQGSVCASMCVPIYLMGKERMAAPGAHFMFHEASVDTSEGEKGGPDALVLDPRARKAFETLATDILYEIDIGGQRVNAQWLEKMRSRIVGLDIWISGQQLVDEGSGVVDTLVPTRPATM